MTVVVISDITPTGGNVVVRHCQHVVEVVGGRGRGRGVIEIKIGIFSDSFYLYLSNIFCKPIVKWFSKCKFY